MEISTVVYNSIGLILNTPIKFNKATRSINPIISLELNAILRSAFSLYSFMMDAEKSIMLSL